ncbi:MAG: sodium:calcium antiporter [Nitrospirae bacterium]|nr:MAG: sodium:calcium antiporter [Nitrospirota bacterium]
MIISLLLFLLGIAIILGGAAVFTNGVEWLGRRMGISDGAIGSILAGIATALPETLIPVIAIFGGHSETETDIGIGAILGAPLMLGTLTLPLLAGFVLLLARRRKRSKQFELDYHAVRLDLGFFLGGYGLAFLVSFTPVAPVRYAVAFALILSYLWYVKIHLTSGEVSGMEIAPLYLARHSRRPATGLIVVQALLGLALMIGGANMFVHLVKDVALHLGVSPLILSLLIAPVATEMPEAMNSFFWVYKKKDALAVGNITGAMVFQGTFPVAVGLLGTRWALDTGSLLSLILPLAASTIFLLQIQMYGRWQSRTLILPGFLYAGYMGYLFFR